MRGRKNRMETVNAPQGLTVDQEAESETGSIILVETLSEGYVNYLETRDGCQGVSNRRPNRRCEYSIF